MPLLGDTKEKRTARVMEAWKRVCEGRNNPDDGLICAAHLAVLTGNFTSPDLETWIKANGSASGYDLHCVAHAAKRGVFVSLLPFLNLDRVRLRDLEMIADEFRS